MKRNKQIQFLRIVSMFMIVICHLVMQYDSSFLKMTAQFFNVGVYVFLLISGVLYGGREIQNYIKWFFRKMFKLMIPVFLFLPFIFVLDYALLDYFSLSSIFVYLFNLQGIFGGIQGAGHLWFLTTIMFCYLTIPCMRWFYKKKRKFVRPFVLSVMAIMAIILSFVNGYIGQQLFYILIFSFGYLYGAKLRKLSVKPVILLIVVVLMFAIRIIMRKFFDDTVLYNIIFSSITHIVISGCFFIFVFQLRCINRLSVAILNEMDSISYFVYIVHYPFMVGPISLMHLTFMPILNTLLTLSSSYVAAKMLQISSGYVVNKVLGGGR